MPFETFFLGRLKVKVMGSNKGQNGHIELVWVITCTFMHGFQNNCAQLFASRRRSAI